MDEFAVEEDVGREALTNEQIAALVERELTSAGETYDGAYSSERAQALNYYLGKSPGQDVAGRSSLISTDVGDMVEHTLAQVMDSFHLPNLVEVQANSVADEPQAHAETVYLNHVFFQENDGWMVLYNGCKDALIYKIGVAAVEVDTTPVVDYQVLQGLDDFALAALFESGADVVDHDEEVGQDGMAIYTVTVRQTRPQVAFKTRSVSGGDFFVNVDHDSLFLQDARFVAERVLIPAADLVESGLSQEVVDTLPAYSRMDNGPTPSDAAQWQLRTVECYYVYMRIDLDGDGIAERYKLLYSNRKVLEMTPHRLVPYAVACPFPLPHEFRGLSMYDKIKQIQDAKTSFLRISMDNGLALTYGRLGVLENAVNMKDLLTPVPGGVIRMKRPDGIVPLNTAGLGTMPNDMLNYLDKMRREAGGSALDMSSQNMPVNLETAHGAERLISSIEQFVALIAGTFANTFVRELFKILHQMLRMYGHPVVAYVNGQDMAVNPAMWPQRDRFSVTIGLSAGERQRQLGALQLISQQQQAAMQAGFDGTLVTPQNIYNSYIDLARVTGLSNPDQYWVDPSSPEAQQAAQQKAQMAQMAAQQQQEMAAMQLKLQEAQVMVYKMGEETKRLRVQLEDERIKALAMSDDQFKRTKLTVDTILEQDKLANDLTEMELKYNEDIAGSKV